MFGKQETGEEDNGVIQNKITTKDYFASMEGDKPVSKTKLLLKLAIDSPLSHLF